MKNRRRTRDENRDGEWKKHVAHFVGKEIVAGSLEELCSVLFCWVSTKTTYAMQLGHIIVTPLILFLGVNFFPSLSAIKRIHSRRITEGWISTREFIRGLNGIHVNCEECLFGMPARIGLNKQVCNNIPTCVAFFSQKKVSMYDRTF